MDDATKYKKAFNQGYILAKHAPTLIESLKPSVDRDNDYLKGILHGADQYEKDKQLTKELFQSKNQIIDKKDKNHDLDIEKDYD